MESQVTSPQSTLFDTLAGDYWEFQKSEYPWMGGAYDKRYQRELAKEAISDYERRYAIADNLTAKLRAVDIQSLSETDKINYQIMEKELNDIRKAYELDEHLRPTFHPFGPLVDLDFTIQKTVLSSLGDLDNYISRLADIGPLLDAMKARLKEGLKHDYRLPRILLSSFIGNVAGYLEAQPEDSLWFQPIKQLSLAITPEIDAHKSKAITLILKAVAPAYKRLADYLEQEYSEHCRDSIACCDTPNGAEYYDYLIQHHTSLTLSPDEIHEKGLQEVARIQHDLEEIATQAGYKNLDDYKAFLNSDPQFFVADKYALQERFQILSKQIDRRIPEFFGHLPRISYGIEIFSESISPQRPVAMAQPNPADGSASGIHWITALVETSPTYMHIPLCLHEAWPGHLMHMALMQEMQDMPLFRRSSYFKYNAYLEGWALYCEKLGIEMGMYKTPDEHYGRLDMEMWRALRLVIDTGIHAKKWSREKAINYMQKYLAMPEKTITTEVDRYIGFPAQALSYKLGEIKIVELRKKSEKYLGKQFVLRDFHDFVLQTGPVTLKILEMKIVNWIKSIKCA